MPFDESDHYAVWRRTSVERSEQLQVFKRYQMAIITAAIGVESIKIR